MKLKISDRSSGTNGADRNTVAEPAGGSGRVARGHSTVQHVHTWRRQQQPAYRDRVYSRQIWQEETVQSSVRLGFRIIIVVSIRNEIVLFDWAPGSQSIMHMIAAVTCDTMTCYQKDIRIYCNKQLDKWKLTIIHYF